VLQLKFIIEIILKGDIKMKVGGIKTNKCSKCKYTFEYIIEEKDICPLCEGCGNLERSGDITTLHTVLRVFKDNVKEKLEKMNTYKYIINNLISEHKMELSSGEEVELPYPKNLYDVQIIDELIDLGWEIKSNLEKKYILSINFDSPHSLVNLPWY